MEAIDFLKTFLTPLTIAIVGYFIQRTLAQQGRVWSVKERAANKLVEHYDDLVNDISIMYWYIANIGPGRYEHPDHIILAKERAERIIYLYQPLWSSKTLELFYQFMNSSFQSFTGYGHPPKIRAGNKLEEWKSSGRDIPKEIEKYFVQEFDPEIREIYKELISQIANDVMFSYK